MISKDTIVTDEASLVVRRVPLTDQNIGEEIALILEAAAWTADDANEALGLASSQVGSKRSWFVMRNPMEGRQINPSPGSAPVLMIANPKIIEFKGRKVSRRESCFSLPDESFDLRRHSEILVRYQRITQDGRLEAPTKAIFSGLAAQIFQHESSHCRGVLICHVGEKVVSATPAPPVPGAESLAASPLPQ
jgi:peptide deformylase